MRTEHGYYRKRTITTTSKAAVVCIKRNDNCYYYCLLKFHTDARIMITQQNVQNCMASDYT